MKLGLLTPVVTLNPRIHNSWEEDGTIDDVVTVAQAADRLGFHHLTFGRALLRTAGGLWDIVP
jgi:hypothetical protein